MCLSWLLGKFLFPQSWLRHSWGKSPSLFFHTMGLGHWQLSCMALSVKKSLTNLLFSFWKSLTIVLQGFKLVKNHWQIFCMAVRNHWQMSIMAVRQKVDKITGNSWQNYCNSSKLDGVPRISCDCMTLGRSQTMFTDFWPFLIPLSPFT